MCHVLPRTGQLPHPGILPVLLRLSRIHCQRNERVEVVSTCSSFYSLLVDIFILFWLGCSISYFNFAILIACIVLIHNALSPSKHQHHREGEWH